ncbi:MAG: hypothetical protein NEA02_18410 [Thermoanaerobaculia bacterium]|nr:hypothetical protein [Thermoanaerobaculia bacterium]
MRKKIWLRIDVSVLALMLGAKLFAGTPQPAAGQQMPVSTPTPPPAEGKKLPAIGVAPVAQVTLSEQCQRTRDRAGVLRAELEASLAAQLKTAAEQYVAKPGPGVSTEKAWGGYAAAASLTGGATVAAWAGLKAAEIRWTGETVTNAGIYLYQLGKTQDALQFLNCAYEMGNRSPYLFEALAIVHQTGGNNGQARQFINQALSAAPDDVLIETEASFINTGQPPPARPPQRDPDGLDEALRELEEHAQRALSQIKAQADTLVSSLSHSSIRGDQQISADYINRLVQIARDGRRDARAEADPTLRQVKINSALDVSIYDYAEISNTLLSFPDATKTSGSPLLLWADALGLDAPVLARESRHLPTSTGGWYGGLAQGAYKEYFRDKDAASKAHMERRQACRNDPCGTREDARWCGVWKQLYEVWENASRQRHNTAARNFDRVATRRVIEAENEYLQVRDYAVRQFRKMRFRKLPRYDEEQIFLRMVNSHILPVYERHVNPPAGVHGGTVLYLRDQALWFKNEARSGMDRDLASEARSMQIQCEPAVRALLELLAQEEWQAYLDHLKDRLAWDIQPKTESDFPCEGSIGPLTIETDLNKPGEGKFDLKWKGKSFQGGGNVTVGPGGVVSWGGGGGIRGSSADKHTGIVIVATGNSASGPGFGQSVSYGPFQGKGKVSFTSKVSPWNSQEYLGIKLKGSAGLGLSNSGVEGRVVDLGVKCYPSSGSVTIYPRALYDDAVRFLSTPTTPPRP